MNGRRLLDTNIVIAVLEGEPSVEGKVDASESTHTSSTVLGELFFGAAKSSKVGPNRLRIEQFAARFSVLDVDSVTARHYGDLKELLKRKGRPIPENDIWIAAVALQHDLTLVTRDRHFKEVPGLSLESW